MRELRRAVGDLAHGRLPVLIRAPSGCGKQLVAEALHAGGPRADGALVVVNCGALPPNLVDAELFGCERGSYTGADQVRAGLFEQAHGGTLFLDEIAELPASAQVKLLRVVEANCVRRIGAACEIAVDVRLVAATNRDLEAMVTRGEFREDLYYRIQAVTVRIPSLAERREDIPAIVRSLLAEAAPNVAIDEEALAYCASRSWPGNVRELRNRLLGVIELTRATRLDRELLVAHLGPVTTTGNELQQLVRRILTLSLDRAPRRVVDELFAQAHALGGTRRAAVRLLKVERKVVDRWCHRRQPGRDVRCGKEDAT